jgi:hypothetical protein
MDQVLTTLLPKIAQCPIEPRPGSGSLQIPGQHFTPAPRFR